MKAKNIEELRDAIRHCRKLLGGTRHRDSIRLLGDICENLGVEYESTGRAFLVNLHDGKKTRMKEFSSLEQARRCEKWLNDQRQFVRDRMAQNKADFPGEFDEKPKYSRPHIFITKYKPRPIDSAAEIARFNLSQANSIRSAGNGGKVSDVPF